MPVIQKQSLPQPVASRPTFGDDIMDMIVPSSNVEKSFMRSSLYGLNRSGKSTLAVEWPKPLLYIACEPTENGGTDSILGREGVDITVVGLKPKVQNGKVEPLAGSKKVIHIAEKLAMNAPYYKTVVVDVTALQDIVLSEIMKWDDVSMILKWGAVKRERYMERANVMRNVLKRITALPCDAVLISQEKDHNPMVDEDGRPVGDTGSKSYIAESVGGSTAEWLHDACNFILRLYVEPEVKETTTMIDMGGVPTPQTIRTQTGKYVRRLRTSYHPNYAGGVRSNLSSCVPEYIETNDAKAMYEDLVRIYGGQRAIHGKYLL